MNNHRRQNAFVRAIKKIFLSAFVIVTFAAYALVNRVSTAGRTAEVPGGVVPTPSGPAVGTTTQPATAPTKAPVIGPATRAPARAPAAPPPTATATSPAPFTTSSGYKDGTYTGPVVDVDWGYVQVRATIQSGKISNVQFLRYPNDRRTSVRINQIANPELQQEAIAAQSANVDIISGATLTSEGFQMSLQAALKQAKS